MGENNPILRRLLLLMVLVKYLEDRGVFPTGWFGRFHKGATNFFEVLQGGDTIEVNKLLASLERKFNGDVFDLSRLDTRGLTKATLTQFAGLVEARTLRRQRYLWQQFSFEHLPVEIISHLYQRFVEDGHGAVYTPHFLASLLLDHVMPYKHLTGKERILDPACGSAVFLVGAFRRLVNFWRSQHNWERPTVETLKNLLRNSIYGIDLDSSAIDLSAFSLSLAICDALKPNVIWNQLKYDRLRDSNLFEKDFFDLLLDSRKGIRNCLQNKFDIVIGNPPFESELTHSAKQVDRIAQKSESSRGNCPDNNLAYLFLEQALTLVCAQNGQVCLIQPSGLLYNSNTNKFRINLFQKCQTHTIFDFTSIRKLYDAADPKTIALSASNLNPAPDHCINHWTFRRTVSAKEKMCFELDHYDCHKVTLEQAKSNPHIWRADLLGGGRLVDLSMQFQSMRTVAEYIASKKGWDYGVGYIAAKTGKREPASFLTGKRLLPAKALTQSGIDESQIGEVKETSFRSPYTENRYSSPLILIRKVESLPMVFLDKGFLAYRNEIVGIHAPEPSRTELQHLYDVFCDKHDILKFVITLHGARSFVSKSTSVFKSDVDQLPFPEKSSSFKLSFWEQALKDDVLNYMSDYVRLGQNSQLLRKAAGKKEVCGYSNMFIRMLGSIYGNLKAGDPIFFNKLICQPFYFGDSAKLEWISRSAESQLTRLVYYKKHDHLRTVRVVRFYDKNVILIVKPDRLRYWIRSTAIRDADETLVDLYNQGY